MKNLTITRSEAIRKVGIMAAGAGLFTTEAKDREMYDDYLKKEYLEMQDNPVIKKAIEGLEYLTPADNFIVQRRGNPVLTEIPGDKLASIGLTKETWRLEIIPDPESDAVITSPAAVSAGNAIRWEDLMELAGKHAVSFLHVLACTNAPAPYGMGLWEGVPLRLLLWRAGIRENIRRVIFHGYHNNDPKQLFQSSLHISRILEEAPGELPVILCYKLNGRDISHANGGPVRLFIPGYYGNRSIKWLQKVIVTNDHRANDTYAEGNNDVEGPLKTCAMFITTPEKVKAGEHFAFTGTAQVGISGLKKVQYMIHPSGMPVTASDPFSSSGEWKDAIILPPPLNWGSDLPYGKLPDVLQVDKLTGMPFTWPLPNTIAHWVALASSDIPGEYEILCRTIDSNGNAQPMPRPFGRSGVNKIQSRKLIIEA